MILISNKDGFESRFDRENQIWVLKGYSMGSNNILCSFTFFICLALATFTSCSKDETEVRKFPSAQPHERLTVGSLTSITLANGVTAYFQEEHSHDQIAIEVLYRAGAIHEGEGKALISVVTTRTLFYSGSPSFKANEAVERIKSVGRINAETVGGFTHYDYIIPPDHLDLALQIEAERLAPRSFSDELLKASAEKCSEDIDNILNNPFGSLVKYSLMAFNQAFNYKKTRIPIYTGGRDLRTDDVGQFQNTYYRPADMVIVLVGDFDTEEAKTLVKKRFEQLPTKPAPAIQRDPVKGFHEATWDIDADVVFFAFPGPYRDAKERLTLTMFGAFLNYHFANDATANQKFKTVYTSNIVYPVRDLPFFIFTQPKTGLSIEEIRAAILLPVQNIIGGFSETFFDAMKSNITDFMESSMLASQFNVSGIPHHQLIGQAALNIGMKHLLKEDLDDLEFAALVDAISFDEAKQILESRFSRENMGEIVIRSQGN